MHTQRKYAVNMTFYLRYRQNTSQNMLTNVEAKEKLEIHKSSVQMTWIVTMAFQLQTGLPVNASHMWPCCFLGFAFNQGSNMQHKQADNYRWSHLWNGPTAANDSKNDVP